MQIKHENVLISPDDARKYLGYNYAHNRPVSQQHVEYLAGEILAGRFLQTAQIHIMHVNGQPTLINGQHTLAAVIKTGRNVMIDLAKSYTDNPGDLALFYSFGHDTGKIRTARDALSAYNLAEEFELHPTQVKRLHAAIKYMALGFDRRENAPRVKTIGQPSARGISVPGVAGTIKISPVDLMPAMKRFADSMRVFSRITRPVVNRQIRDGINRASGLSVALVTMKYQPGIAIDFWRRISQASYRDPSGELRDPALVVAQTIDRSYKKQLKNTSPALFTRHIAHCWGREFTGSLMQYVRLREGCETDIISIAGTPWDGTQDDYDMIMNDYD